MRTSTSDGEKVAQVLSLLVGMALGGWGVTHFLWRTVGGDLALAFVGVVVFATAFLWIRTSP